MEPPGLGAANYTPYHGAMKTTVFGTLFALAAGPLTSVTEKIPGSEHGFIFVTRNAKGVYAPDPAQRQIVSEQSRISMAA
jgi:hypothetical protein